MKKYFLLLMLIMITLNSCVTMALKSIGALEEKSKPFYITNGTKKVLFFGMHHVGKHEFYNGVKASIDSLQKIGYYFYLESVRYDIQDSIKIDIYNRKFRKIVGFIQGKEGYLDTINHKIGNILSYNPKLKLTNQPPYRKMNLSNNISKIVDVPKNKIIDAFENEFGVVNLDSCDYKTALNIKYLCKKIDIDLYKKFKEKYVHELRNKNLVNEILTSEHTKIGVIYGKNHYKRVLEILQEHDHNWKEVKN